MSPSARRAVPADQFIREHEARRERGSLRWEKFEKGSRARAPTVVVSRRGTLVLNVGAYRLLAMPKGADLLYERTQRMVGIRSADPGKADCYTVGRGQGYGLISAKAFVDAISLPPGRYPARVLDGMLVFALTDREGVS